jgi:hypothetical protein
MNSESAPTLLTPTQPTPPSSLHPCTTGLVLPSFPQHAVSVKYATEHRCGVVVRGPGLTDAIDGTDPLKDNLPLLQAKPTDDTPEV